MHENFKPNSATFDFGVQRVEDALKKAGKSLTDGIITSKDKDIQPILKDLEVKNIPDNFKKWQLPFIFQRTQVYLSVGYPDAEVPEHSHDEGEGIRIIVSGSIYYGDKTLNAGDWMFIPKGKKYSFNVGAHGATMFYCYNCSCP